MNYRAEHRPSALGAGRYLERLSKALPGKAWSRTAREFWPDNAKLVISISLQFDAGNQSDSRSSGPFPSEETGYPGLASWHDYGFKEGVPRLLDVFQRRHVRMTAHMGAAAVDRSPQIAREIVERGHEPAARVAPRSGLAPSLEEERKGLETAIDGIRRTTGTRPLGLSSGWLRGTSNTLDLLQELGFLYSADDASRDEPSLVTIRAKPLVLLPCALGMDDVVAYESRLFSSDQYASELKNEFEMLYSEAESRRRLMSISAHACISGRPARAKVLEEFIIYAQRRPGVVFLRKDDIARFALASAVTPREEALRKGREAA